MTDSSVMLQPTAALAAFSACNLDSNHQHVEYTVEGIGGIASILTCNLVVDSFSGALD